MTSVGEFVKVWLPGETPWAECVAVHDDGTWEGRIANRLFAEMPDDERRAALGAMGWANAETLPRLHSFKQGQVVRFRRDETNVVWVPAEPSGGRA